MQYQNRIDNEVYERNGTSSIEFSKDLLMHLELQTFAISKV